MEGGSCEPRVAERLAASRVFQKLAEPYDAEESSTGERTGATGLEPATSGVTGRRSNQLNYAPEPR